MTLDNVCFSFPQKKVVRFEDDDVNGDTKQTLKARQLDYLQSKVLHEKSSAYSHVIRRKSNSIDSLNNLVDRLALQELKNSQSRSPKSSPVDSPVKFKSTFPIDQPISKSVHFNTVPARKKKVSTYPVDEKCCDLNEPCDEHDDYLYETGYDYNSRHDADEFLHNTTVPDLDFRKVLQYLCLCSTSVYYFMFCTTCFLVHLKCFAFI